MASLLGTSRSSGMAGIVQYFMALLLGSLAVLALPPFSIPLILPVVFGGLFHLTTGQGRARAFLTGWMFGLGFFLFGLSWIAESFSVDAARFGWLALPAVAGLAAGLALFPAAATAAFAASRTTGISGALIFAACWSGSEWLRGTVLTGFPWNLVAYAWADFDVPRQTAVWVGSYGLSLLTVLLSTLPVVIALPGSTRRGAAILLWATLAAGTWAIGAVRIAEGVPSTEVTVRIVQGNIPQRLKWDPAYQARAIATYLELSARPGRFDLLLWPETAFPGYLDEDDGMLERLSDILPDEAVLLTGAQTRDVSAGGTVYRNSILAIDGAGNVIDRYAKHHLVPFGEYVPLGGLLPIEKLTAGIGAFTPGPGPETFTPPGLPAVGLSICYEAIFPGRIVDAAERPAWIFNATNDAWFGASIGPEQHLASARMRAVEEGLPLVRAANTGISAVIDGYGRIGSRLDLDETGVIDARLPEALPPTPFSRYGQLTYAILFLLCIAGPIGGKLAGRRLRKM